jgi:hypothetical protein
MGAQDPDDAHRNPLFRFKAEQDIVLTPDETAEAIPELAEYAHTVYDKPLVTYPSVIERDRQLLGAKVTGRADDWSPYSYPYRHHPGRTLVFPVAGVKAEPHDDSPGRYVSVEGAATRMGVSGEAVVELLRAGHLVAHWVRAAPDNPQFVIPRVVLNSVKDCLRRERVRRRKERRQSTPLCRPESTESA